MRIETPYGCKSFSSPIEQAFYEAWCRRITENNLRPQLYYLDPQHQIGRYRVDFAHLRTRTVIELLGQATHSSTAAIAYDCKRQREIEALGWRVVRFGGREIFTDVEAVVDEVGQFLQEQMIQKGQVRIVRENTTPHKPITVVRENTTPCSNVPYKPGDKVVHPQFGPGAIIHAGHVLANVQFQDDTRMLNLTDLKPEKQEAVQV